MRKEREKNDLGKGFRGLDVRWRKLNSVADGTGGVCVEELVFGNRIVLNKNDLNETNRTVEAFVAGRESLLESRAVIIVLLQGLTDTVIFILIWEISKDDWEDCNG